MSPPIRLEEIVGYASDPDMGERLHALQHVGQVEIIELDRQDMARRRLRTRTDAGQDCVIVLPRAERLGDGAVLLLKSDRAIVVRAATERWLMLAPRDTAAAIELGYFAGNMHWRVLFDGPRLRVALEGPEQAYLERLAALFDDGRIGRVADD